MCVFVCVIMATNFLELATTLKYLGAKWLLEKESLFYALCSPVIDKLAVVERLLFLVIHMNCFLLCLVNFYLPIHMYHAVYLCSG